MPDGIPDITRGEAKLAPAMHAIDEMLEHIARDSKSAIRRL
jgi:hypothetical protein